MSRPRPVVARTGTLARVPPRRIVIPLEESIDHIRDLLLFAHRHATSSGHPVLVYVHGLAYAEADLISLDADCQCTVCSERRRVNRRRTSPRGGLPPPPPDDDERQRGAGRRKEDQAQTPPPRRRRLAEEPPEEP